METTWEFFILTWTELERERENSNFSNTQILEKEGNFQKNENDTAIRQKKEGFSVENRQNPK